MIRLTSALAVLFLLPSLSRGADVKLMKFFEMKVRPLLAENCFECHDADKMKGGLRLDHIDFILEGGDTGPALVKGKPGESLIIEVTKRLDPDFAMPPKKELSSDQVAILERWIADGAFWPAESVEGGEERDENGFTQTDRNWWAIQPLAKATIPSSGKEWAKNEIDRFVFRKMEENRLQPADTASASELVRRMFLDVHGLPPTPEQVDEFVTAYENNPDAAVAQLADTLLAHPRYGERWGQHWLDVVRYSESDGYRADDYRPDAWRYRDYVIRSLNDDKPYDQFIREQIAGDELYGDNPDALIGTAFLRHGVYEWNQRNARMQWDLILTEMTNVTSEAFLGLGMGCAQCHDHKFDPILQKDYFALQSFLNTTWWPENAPLATPEELAAYEKQKAEWEKATAEIRKELDAMKEARIESNRKGVVKQFPEDVQDIYRKPQEERTAYEEQLAQLVQRQVDHKFKRVNWDKEFEKKKEENERYLELKKKLAAFDNLKPKDLPRAFITTDVKLQPAVTQLKKRGEEITIEPAFLTLLGDPKPEIQPTETTTGRRTALAEWIADEDNPFTARVMVNRIWQRHFKQGLVPTPNDFGRLGEEPSHPELLDWLTREFLDGGWKMKAIHRLILTSSTYRQTAQREPTSVEEITDPDNRFLWRYPPHRLDAEQIRDAMLMTSGELQEFENRGSSIDGNSPYRSIYMKKKRNTRDSMIGSFDAPSRFASAPQRVSTTSPNQSLLLVNGEWTLKRAQAFAKRILAGKSQPDAEMVKDGYRLAYGREPLTAEVEGALAFIESQIEVIGKGTGDSGSDAYPGETGLRPIEQHFSKSKDLAQGDKSLWLQPGSRFERLELVDLKLPEQQFTVEAVAILDSLYKDASVKTLASRWDGSHTHTGWSLGVTSEKSRYQPRNLILQIVGDDFQGNRIYEVVASDLRVPLQTPFFAAAAISAVPSRGDVTKGKVTFYLLDLSDPNASMQTATVPHQVVGGLEELPDIPTLVGGRHTKHHQWDGQVARLRFSNDLLAPQDLLIHQPEKGKGLLDLVFGGEKADPPFPGTTWQRHTPGSSGQPSRLLAAVADFCHALLNSNEFLYLH